MAPDPPAYPVDESLTHNYDTAIAVPNSDDSDNEIEEQQAYDGYTLLGQHEHIGGPIDNEQDSESEYEVTDGGIQNSAVQEQDNSIPPPSVTAGRAEVAALWNSVPEEVSSNSITMDDERSAQIRAAMAGFSLPPSAVPAWASDIPEELWKERLLGRLHQGTGKTEPSKR